MERIILKSRQGFVYTNGENYGKVIYLANSENARDYYEITEQEYERIMKEKEENIRG